MVSWWRWVLSSVLLAKGPNQHAWCLRVFRQDSEVDTLLNLHFCARQAQGYFPPCLKRWRYQTQCQSLDKLVGRHYISSSRGLDLETHSHYIYIYIYTYIYILPEWTSGWKHFSMSRSKLLPVCQAARAQLKAAEQCQDDLLQLIEGPSSLEGFDHFGRIETKASQNSYQLDLAWRFLGQATKKEAWKIWKPNLQRLCLIQCLQWIGQARLVDLVEVPRMPRSRNLRNLRNLHSAVPKAVPKQLRSVNSCRFHMVSHMVFTRCAARIEKAASTLSIWSR